MDKIDHDRLIEVDAKVNYIIKMLDNHLKHHWAVTLAFIVTTLGLAAAVVKLVVF